MPTDPTPTDLTSDDSMPTESTPGESTPPESTPGDGGTVDRGDGVTRRTEPAETESQSPDPSGLGSGGERDAAADGERIAELERRVTELEAELEAVRGLLGGVEAIDEAVERRASIALAKAEALEERIGLEEGLVRERLPETGDDQDEARNDRGEHGNDQRNAGDERTDHRGETHCDTGLERESRRDDSRLWGSHTGEAAERADAVGPSDHTGRTSAATTGSGRSSHTDTDATGRGATDQEPTESGAISSVGPDGADEGGAPGAAEDDERSLAARLRDAVR